MIRAASKSDQWQLCFDTLQLLRPHVESTRLLHSDNKGIVSTDKRYNQLTPALTAVTRSLESHSQYGLAVRVIEDWIEWSGRAPQIEAVLSTIRVLSASARVVKIKKLVT